MPDAPFQKRSVLAIGLLAGALAWSLGQARAQDGGTDDPLVLRATGLRGTILIDPVSRPVIPGVADVPADPSDDGFAGAYRPVSAGALPDDRDDGVPSAAADPFDEPLPEIPARAIRVGPTGQQDGVRDELRLGAVPPSSVDAADLDRNRRALSDAERIAAVEGRDRASFDQPFEPLGIRLANFLLFPSLEQGVGWTSNANGGANGGSAFFSQTALRLAARSDWSRHQAELRGFAIRRDTIDGAEISDRELGFDANLRLDLAGDYAARAAASYLRRPESATSPVSFEDAVTRPDRQTLAGQLGIAKEEGRLRLGLTGNVVRDTFDDALSSSGGVISQAERDSTLATVALRGGYEISPALLPFAEIEIGRRIHDQRLDSAGFARSADRYALRGGVGVELGEKFAGEIALGWLRETPDDPALRPVSGLSVEGNLAWSPQRGTVIDLTALTSVEGSTTPGASGSLLYALNLAATREMRADLTGTASLGAEYRDYSGSRAYDLTWSGEVSLSWWLNRYMALTARARHEIVDSSDPGRESDTTSIFGGMRFQR